MFLVVMPLGMYIFFALFVRLLSEDERYKTWGETLSDAFCLGSFTCFKVKEEQNRYDEP